MTERTIMMIEKSSPVCVLGCGSWGSTLAWLYARENSLPVRIWGRDSAKLAQINSSGYFDRPLKVAIPDNLRIVPELGQALEGASVIVLACTAQSMRELCRRVAGHLHEKSEMTGSPILVGVVKGLEPDSLARMSEVVASELPGLPYCALSGPNLAFEIRSFLPCASVLASNQLEYATTLQRLLNNQKLRLYVSDDLIGVELGGALKNVIAIAAGASDGLDLGVNAKAALVTRGLKEMSRLACAMGAQTETLSGLSGMGDLLATCQGNLSRNYRVGFYLARGNTLAEASQMIGAVAEGVGTARSVCELAKRHCLEMPISHEVMRVLSGEASCLECIQALMARPLVQE